MNSRTYYKRETLAVSLLSDFDEIWSINSLWTNDSFGKLHSPPRVLINEFYPKGIDSYLTVSRNYSFRTRKIIKTPK